MAPEDLRPFGSAAIEAATVSYRQVALLCLHR